MNDLETLKLQVLALSAEDRAVLIEEVLASLDSKAREAVDKAKVDEVERRRKAYHEGRICTVTLEESRRRMVGVLGVGPRVLVAETTGIQSTGPY